MFDISILFSSSSCCICDVGVGVDDDLSTIMLFIISFISVGFLLCICGDTDWWQIGVGVGGYLNCDWWMLFFAGSLIKFIGFVFN